MVTTTPASGDACTALVWEVNKGGNYNGVAAWLGDFGENGLLISVLYQVKIECSLFVLNAAISVICNELNALYNEDTKRHMNN